MAVKLTAIFYNNFLLFGLLILFPPKVKIIWWLMYFEDQISKNIEQRFNYLSWSKIDVLYFFKQYIFFHLLCVFEY